MAIGYKLTKMSSDVGRGPSRNMDKAAQNRREKGGTGLLGAVARNKPVQNRREKVGTGLVGGAAKTVSQAVKKRIDAGAASKLGGPGDVPTVRQTPDTGNRYMMKLW